MIMGIQGVRIWRSPRHSRTHGNDSEQMMRLRFPCERKHIGCGQKTLPRVVVNFPRSFPTLMRALNRWSSQGTILQKSRAEIGNSVPTSFQSKPHCPNSPRQLQRKLDLTGCRVCQGNRAREGLYIFEFVQDGSIVFRRLCRP
jgi:hypothetical protein